MKQHDSIGMAEYYAKRAPTYEQEVYARPERQDELDQLKERLAELAAGQKVLELACGSGYWTEELAASADSVLATDINAPMLELARARGLSADKVRFAMADATDARIDGDFSLCFAGFFWSHVKREEQAGFLAQLRNNLGAGTMLVMIDNTYVEGSSTVIARTDLEGNTYQIRTLPDGERYEVLKNFPTDSALRKKLAAFVRDIRIVRLEHFWMLTGKLK